MKLTIYHNPRCRKSREALTYLEENGHQPTVVDYQKELLSENDLARLLKELDYTAEELVRKTKPFGKQTLKVKIGAKKNLSLL